MTKAAISKLPVAKAEKSAPSATLELQSTLNPFKFLVGVIIQPATTFEVLREAKRSYWWVVLLITIVFLALSAVISSSAVARTFQNASPPAGAPVIVSGQGGPSSGVRTGSNMLQIALPLAAGIALTVVDYLLRAAVMFGGSLILGGKATFRQSFRMGVWTTIPYALRDMVQSVAMLISGGQAVKGLSAMLTTAESVAVPILNYILSAIDFYMLWSIILMGIGTVVTTRLSRSKGLVVMAFYVGLALAGSLILFAVGNAFSTAIGGAGPQRFPGGGARP